MNWSGASSRTPALSAVGVLVRSLELLNVVIILFAAILDGDLVFGVPRESLPGYRRAVEVAAAIFDRALALLDEPASEIDLASALAVLGSADDEVTAAPGGFARPRARAQHARN